MSNTHDASIAPELSGQELFEIRKAKIAELEKKGLQAWPTFKPVTATCADVLSKGSALTTESNEDSSVFAISGRLMTKREHGKTMFAHLQDRSGKIQIYVRKDAVGDEVFETASHLYDLGDIIWAQGTLFLTKTGEVTLKVTELFLQSKCLHPLPEKYHGLADVEQCYRQRYLDLMSNDETRQKFARRSKIIQGIRQFLLDKDFLEVETPMLHSIPGGAAARPFTTHHNAYDMDLFLRISPELFLKRLVIGGLERVFEINRNFRNEGISTRHNPEFTMLEFYMAYGDYNDGIALTEAMFAQVMKNTVGTTEVQFGRHQLNFASPFKRLTVEESLIEIGGLTEEQISQKNIDALIKEKSVPLANKNASYGEKLFALFEAFVEGNIVQPTFIVGYPIAVSPLAKKDPKNQDLAARFELFVAGMEIANGFTELNDPLDQAERFKMQVDARASGDAEAHHYDADYVKALEYGLPPAVGVGIGIDRFVMLLTNTTSIKDVILFPTLKHKN